MWIRSKLQQITSYFREKIFNKKSHRKVRRLHKHMNENDYIVLDQDRSIRVYPIMMDKDNDPDSVTERKSHSQSDASLHL